MMRRVGYTLALILILGIIRPAEAEQVDLIFSWKASSYAPADFPGKIFPTSNSEVAVSVALIADGKVADLSNHTVNWYVDGTFFKGGRGQDTIIVTAPEVAGSIIEIRADIPTYTSAEAVDTIEIPVRAPEAVIEAIYPYRQFSDIETSFRARPYFFNITGRNDASFTWTVNGKPAGDSTPPDVLDISVLPDTADNFEINLSLAISNPSAFFERAAGSLSLRYRR
jgi:hypothetical protein